MSNFTIECGVKRAAKLLTASKNIVVLTGAGMSTESGIPDFRSRTGIYSSNPSDILSIQYFKNNPKEFWDFIKKYLNWINAEPNIGHEIIAKWEQNGLVNSIITQNIDELHQKAGSSSVLQIHGTMNTASCEGCFRKYNMSFVIQQDESYKCVGCGNPYVRPDVVLFGEAVTAAEKAINITKQADLMIVMGTSLQVYPVASLPGKIKYGGNIIIINNSTTDYDYKKNVVAIKNGIGDTLIKIDEILCTSCK